MVLCRVVVKELLIVDHIQLFICGSSMQVFGASDLGQAQPYERAQSFEFATLVLVGWNPIRAVTKGSPANARNRGGQSEGESNASGLFASFKAPWYHLIPPPTFHLAQGLSGGII